MAKIVELPDGREAEFPDDMSNDAIGEVLRKQFAASPAPAPTVEPAKPQTLEQLLGPSDFTKSFASTPYRMLKSSMQMVGAGDYVPDAVSRAAAQGDASILGRIAGDIAGTGGIRAGAGALANTLQRLNVAKGFVPAVGRIAEGAGYGAAQGAITTPDQQGEAAIYGAAGGAAMPALGGALRAAGKGGAHLLGMTTGAGAESVRQAFRNGPGFVENMRGNVAPGEVVEQARQGVQTMRQRMYDNYANAKGGWAGDTTPLPFSPIAQAADAAASKFSFHGVPQPGTEAVRQQVDGVLKNWADQGAQNPAFFTVEGLDALKRHLSDIVPDNIANRTGRAYVTEVVNGVKNAITRQAPKYAEAMKDYWSRSNELDEITRSLSLGDKATVDTALRKLQSLPRNNVNSNFGQRVQSAQALATQGGEDILPAVAGQAMNTWTPRGLQAAAATGGGVASLLTNPLALAGAPAFSPRAVGETARGLGMVVNNENARAVVEALRRGVPAASRPSRESGQQE